MDFRILALLTAFLEKLLAFNLLQSVVACVSAEEQIWEGFPVLEEYGGFYYCFVWCCCGLLLFQFCLKLE